jgi:hypothetical protein
MYLLPSSFLNFSKSILYSLGFSSNFYFWHSGQQYGAEDGLLKPFLHTWSLSVEEQFYIIFPIFLLIFFTYFRKYLIHILILGFILSLALADWGTKNHPSFNFYVLPTRAWELLAGSILAYFETKSAYKNTKKYFHTFPSIGLLLILYSIFVFGDEMHHPSFYTIFPIIGVCMIIWFSNKDEIITKILSTKLIVGIGLISYSLYLWHYPILSFARISNFFYYSNLNKFLLYLILIIISILTYFFIEKPFRNKEKNPKILLGGILIVIFILIIGNSIIINMNGFKNRVPEILRVSDEPSWEKLKNKNDEICFNNTKGCKFNISSNKNLYVIGDSHLGVLIFDLKEKAIKKNYKFITSTFIGCGYYPGFNLVEKKTNKIDKKCNDSYFQKLRLKLSKETNSVLIFGGRLPVHLSGNKFDNKEGNIEGGGKHKYVSQGKYNTLQQSFKNEILKLSNNHKIILIYPIPEVGVSPKKQIVSQWIKKGYPKKFDVENFTTSYDVYRERTKTSFELLDTIQNKNIYRVYPHKIFCNSKIAGRCITHDEKNIFYFDDDHLSLEGSKMVNDLIMRAIEDIEKD